MKRDSLHDGRQDGLKPLESIDLSQVGSFADLLRAMSHTAFGGRQLGEAFDILVEATRRENCCLVLTVSGAMTVARQGRIICEMIDRGIVQAVVATGALMAHGLTESIGLTHYRHDSHLSDEELFKRGYNRVYDTLEMESNLNDVAALMAEILDSSLRDGEAWSSAGLCREIGRRLSEQAVGPGILRSAFEREIPVFIPAFTDSELGLDVSTWAMARALAEQGRNPAETTADDVFRAATAFNPFLDLQEYARLIAAAGEIGIMTIGGGVPRNWAQQVAPYIDITNDRLGTRLPVPRFRYGVRLCPEPVHWGGLSGCTYSEGVSWGKFVPKAEGGRFAEVHADATVVWPLLMKAVFEELDRPAQPGETPPAH